MRLIFLICLIPLLSILALHAQTTPLTQAIRLEKFEEAPKYITPELVNKADAGRYHPLTYAVYTSNNELIEALLKAGAKADTVEHNGKTALYVAANFNNVQAIELLAKHGATYPPKDNTYQPAKIAVTENAAKALKALFDAYPDIDLKAGWKKPNRYAGGISLSGGALNFAARYGYNEMGLFLLTKNPNLNAAQSRADNFYCAGPDYRGKKPLHNAAENGKCSLEFLNALLKAGCDPLERTPASHLQCRTPLDYAAASGSLQKVKAILTLCDLKNKTHRSAISRSTFIASAHKHDKIVSHLLSCLGHTLLDPEKWLKKYNVQPSTKGGHNPLREESLRTLMPRIDTNKKARNASGTIAIISPKSLQNTASLLSAELSTVSHIKLLERDALSKVMQESTLKSFQNMAAQTFHKKLELIPAEYVILLHEKKLKSGSFIEFVTVNSVNGIVLSRLAMSQKQAESPDHLKQCVSFILNQLTNNKSTTATAITITPIKPETPSEISLALAETANTSLPYFISNTQDCIHLTRKQLHHLETEKAIGAKGSYWKAAWLIDGGIKVTDNTHTIITLRATNTLDASEITVTQNTHPEKISEGVKSAWIALASKINIANPVPLTKKHIPNELELLVASAKWLLQANYPDDAITCGNAALALGSRKQTIYEILLKAKLKTLPLLKVCDHISRHPRALEPQKRFILARHIPNYLSLTNTSILYTNTLNKQLVTSSDSGGSKSDVYNELVQKTIRELLFFRIIMDDTMIDGQYASDIKALDIEIAQLTQLYLKKARDDKSELATIRKLLERDEMLYYYKHAPELHNQCLMRINQILTKMTQPHLSGDLVDLAYSKARIYQKKGYPKKVWESILTQSIQRSGKYYKVCISAKLSKLATSLQKRKMLQVLCIKQALKARSYHDAASLRFCDLLTGGEYSSIPPDIVMGEWIAGVCFFHMPPQGSILKLLITDPESICETNELRRLWGLYIWRMKLEKADNARWKKNLIAYQNSEDQLPENKIIHPAEWSIFKKIYLKRENPSIKTINILTKLAKKGLLINEDKNHFITLKKIILLPQVKSSPQLGAFSHSQSITMVGDEAWIPTTYIETKRVTPEEYKKHHCIQVINLQTEKIRTIPLPDVLARSDAGSSFKKFFIGKNYIYYRCYENGYNSEKLYAIDLKTYEAQEIKLPLPRIEAIAFNEHTNTLCVSIATGEKDGEDNVSNQVILIQGSEIVTILVSNQRKPPLSPLDKPDTLVTSIHHKKNEITLLSNHTLGYLNPKKVDLAIYHIESKKWSSIPKKRIWQRIDHELREDEKTLQLTTLKMDDYTCYLNSRELWERPHPVLYVSLSKRHVVEGRSSDRLGIYNRKLKTLAQSQTHPLFDKKISNFKVKNYKDDNQSEIIDYGSYQTKGWWYSPNDLIDKGLYSVYVVGKWKKQIVLSLITQWRGLPALWMVPEEEIIRHLRRELEKAPAPITFNNEKLGVFTELKYPHLTITAEKKQGQIYSKSGLENSQTLAVFAKKQAQVIITAQGAFKDGFISLSAHARRALKKPSFQFRIDIWMNGKWKEVYNGDKCKLRIPVDPNINIDFPKKIKKIRFRVTSNSENSVLMDDLILR